MEKKSQNKRKFDLKSYAKYTSMFFQMAIIIGGGVWGGYWLDRLIGLKFPIGIVLCSLVSVAIAIYYVIKDL